MEAHNTQNKNDYPEVIQGVGSNGLDYSKIRVSDFCYFLNDRVDLARNGSYFDGYDPDEFPESEMYEFLKFKTDNFDKIKFRLVINEIRLFTPLYFRVIDGEYIYSEDINNSIVIEWNTEMNLHCYINRTLELNEGLILECEQIKRFSELAEELYQSINDTSAPDTATTQQEYKFFDYLSCANKEAIIEKIRALDRSKPKKIYFILKALFDNGSLSLPDNETIYKAYFNEFGYHKSYDTMKRGLNGYDLNKQDKANAQKIENTINQLFD